MRPPAGHAAIRARRTARRCATTLRHSPKRESNCGAMPSNARAAGRSCAPVISGACGEQHGIGGTMSGGIMAETSPAAIILLPGAHFVMQGVAYRAVESGIEGALEEHGEIAGILPIVSLAQFGAY